MNASIRFPSAPNWNAQDLVDAVPLRLFELFDVDDVAPRAAASNASKTRAWRGAYLATTPLPARVRVHN